MVAEVCGCVKRERDRLPFESPLRMRSCQFLVQFLQTAEHRQWRVSVMLCLKMISLSYFWLLSSGSLTAPKQENIWPRHRGLTRGTDRVICVLWSLPLSVNHHVINKHKHTHPMLLLFSRFKKGQNDHHVQQTTDARRTPLPLSIRGLMCAPYVRCFSITKKYYSNEWENAFKE